MAALAPAAERGWAERRSAAATRAAWPIGRCDGRQIEQLLKTEESHDVAIGEWEVREVGSDAVQLPDGVEEERGRCARCCEVRVDWPALRLRKGERRAESNTTQRTERLGAKAAGRCCIAAVSCGFDSILDGYPRLPQSSSSAIQQLSAVPPVLPPPAARKLDSSSPCRWPSGYARRRSRR